MKRFQMWGSRLQLKTTLLLCLLLVVSGSYPAITLSNTGPKVLLYSSISVWHVADTVQEWGNRGINGFILLYVGEWYAIKEDLDLWMTHVTDLNRTGAAYGVDSNFILVPLAWESWRDNSVLPSWTDDARRWT